MSLLNCIECKSSLTQRRISCDTMASSGILAIDTDVSISAGLPSTAGHDINTRPWLTESLALSRVLRGPPQYIQLSVDLPSSVAVRWSISPFSLLTGHPNKTSPSNIFALWFPEEAVKGNERPARLHLLQLMCGPGGTLSLSARGWGFEGGQRVTGLSVDLAFRAEQRVDGTDSAGTEARCACRINMCAGCLCKVMRDVELTFIRQMLGGLQEFYMLQMCRSLAAVCEKHIQFSPASFHQRFFSELTFIRPPTFLTTLASNSGRSKQDAQTLSRFLGRSFGTHKKQLSMYK